MSFEQIPEILKNVVTENLTDPEQQRSLIKTVAGFVTRPDSDDSAYDYGRFQEINRSNREEEARKVAAAKIKADKDKQLKEKLYDLELKRVESAYRMDEIRLRNKLEKEGKDSKFMQNLFKGDIPLSLALTEKNGIYSPTPSFMVEMALYSPTEKFARMNPTQLTINTEFQNFAKDLFEKQSSKRANKEKTNPILGNKFTQLGMDIGAISPDEGSLVPELLKKGDTTQTNVVKNFPLFLKNSSNTFKALFSIQNPDQGLLNKLYDSANFSDPNQMLTKFRATQQRFNKVRDEAARKDRKSVV